MNVPQIGIFAQGTIAHEFVELDLRPDVDLALATAAFSRLRPISRPSCPSAAES